MHSHYIVHDHVRTYTGEKEAHTISKQKTFRNAKVPSLRIAPTYLTETFSNHNCNLTKFKPVHGKFQCNYVL